MVIEQFNVIRLSYVKIKSWYKTGVGKEERGENRSRGH